MAANIKMHPNQIYIIEFYMEEFILLAERLWRLNSEYEHKRRFNSG